MKTNLLCCIENQNRKTLDQEHDAIGFLNLKRKYTRLNLLTLKQKLLNLN
jgi:hypothetical protein